MNCPRCGAEVIGKGNFCTSCGLKLKETASAEQTPGNTTAKNNAYTDISNKNTASQQSESITIDKSTIQNVINTITIDKAYNDSDRIKSLVFISLPIVLMILFNSGGFKIKYYLSEASVTFAKVLGSSEYADGGLFFTLAKICAVLFYISGVVGILMNILELVLKQRIKYSRTIVAVCGITGFCTGVGVSIALITALNDAIGGYSDWLDIDLTEMFSINLVGWLFIIVSLLTIVCSLIINKDIPGIRKTAKANNTQNLKSQAGSSNNLGNNAKKVHPSVSVCPNCGYALKPGVKFCQKCGTRI